MFGFSLDFVSPAFLFLLVLLPLAFWISRQSLSGLGRRRRVTAIALRLAALLLAVLAVSRMRLLKENDRLCVIFVVDRSDSVAAQREMILEEIKDIQSQRDDTRGDFVGVVVFGKEAGVEASPRQGGLAGPEDDRAEPQDELSLELMNIETLIDPSATSIQSAIQLAAAAFPGGVGGKRIVLFSDGNENLGQALDEIRSVRSMGITVDVVPVSYRYDREVSIEKLIVKPEVLSGQPFGVEVVIQSTIDTEVKLRLFENGALLRRRDAVRRRLEPGRNYFKFPNLRREEPGRYSYRVEVEVLDPDDDQVVQNNEAHGFTSIRGESRVLLCTAEPEYEQALVTALERERMVVDVRAPESLPRSIEEYFDYGVIVLSNVGAHRLSKERMLLFQSLVQGLGTGFVMIGGEESFGAGGYQGTPIEEILPVEMEIKQKKILPNGALCFVVHSCELGNGNMWARQVIQRAIRILSPRDFAGVVYFNYSGKDQWLFPMTRCDQKQQMYNRLRNFNPGDMPSFHGIMKMAEQGLSSVRASIRHIIVLSDGDPGMPSNALLDKIVKQAPRITISTICYGAHMNVTPPGMKMLAERGNGKYYYLRPSDASKLPEIFIREASTVRKSLISEEPFVAQVSSWGEIIQGLDEGLPQLDGYVLTTPKPLADQVLVHPGTAEDPTQDPVLATWTYALGKTVAFTSDAGRRWGKHWVSWSGYQRFWGQLIRWASKAEGHGPLRVSRQVTDGRAKLIINAITEDGEYLSALRIKGHVVSPGPDFETRKVNPRLVGPGIYEMEFDADGSGTYGVNLSTEFNGQSLSFTTGVSVSYSPEYRQKSTNFELLRRLAIAGGGRLATAGRPVDFFSRDFESSKTVQEVWNALLIWALMLFFADVFVRRVMVDPRELYRKVVGVVQSARSDRKAQRRVSDERLATLLKVKARVQRDTTGAAATADQEEPSEAEEFDAHFDAGGTGSVAPDAAREVAKAGSGDREASGPADGSKEESAYTGRLLKAKRRALRGDEDE